MTAMIGPPHASCDRAECVWCQPTLNTPYEPPERHWATVDSRTRDEITPERRPVRSRIPLGRVPEPTQRDLYTGDIEIVSQLRNDVSAWRVQHWPGATPPTARLLEYWARPAGQGPDRRLFFAQREAIETVVYLTEVADVAGARSTAERLGVHFQINWRRSGLVRALGGDEVEGFEHELIGQDLAPGWLQARPWFGRWRRALYAPLTPMLC